MPEEKPPAYGCLIDIHGDSIHRQHDFILWSSSQLCKVVLHFAQYLSATLIEVGVREPHTSELNDGISLILYCMSYIWWTCTDIMFVI